MSESKRKVFTGAQKAEVALAAVVSGGGNPRKDGCKNPLFYNWGSAQHPCQ